MSQRLLATFLSLITVLAFAPSGATLVPDEVSGLEASGALFAAGDHGAGFRALAAEGGWTLGDTPVVAGPAEALASLSDGALDAAGAQAILDQVDAHLVGPVGTLLVAMAQADLLVDDALAGLDPDLAERVRPGGSWVGLSTDGTPVEPAPAILPAPVEGLDLGPFHLAEAILLDAVAVTLPEFYEAAAHPCSPVNEKPFLMVCQSGNDVYDASDNAILIVDVFGDDTYENARGTPFGGLPQVIVDVLGSDTYDASAGAAGGTASVVAQGAGALGIGGIVDIMGHDSYRANAFHLGGQTAAAVLAQGAGLLGVGFLVDPNGIECVEATAVSRGAHAEVIAQGAGALGAGFLFLGGGLIDDEDQACHGGPFADASADPLPQGDGFTLFGSAATIAQGAGSVGAGVLVGGIQHTTYTASSSGGAAITVAQGAGNLGAGALVELAGTDTYLADASVAFVRELSISGSFSFVGIIAVASLGDVITVAQGAGLLGVGVLYDEISVRDTYGATSSLFASLSTSVATTFNGGETVASSSITTGRALALAQGGGEAGAGLLVDLGPEPVFGRDGDDARRMSASLSAHTKAHAGGGALNTAKANTQTSDAEASGQGWGNLGAGALADAGGSDLYSLAASVSATATATLDGPGSKSAVANPGLPLGRGQGQGLAGPGVLADVAGTDTYLINPGGTAAQNDECRSNSPAFDPNVGLAADLFSTASSSFVPASCTPPPH